MSRFVVDVGAEDIARIGHDLGARALAARRPKLLAAAAGLGFASVFALIALAPRPLPLMFLAGSVAFLLRAFATETKRWVRHAAASLPVGTYVFEAGPRGSGAVRCVERPDGTRFPAPQHLDVLRLPSGRLALRGERPWWVLPAGSVGHDRVIAKAG